MPDIPEASLEVINLVQQLTLEAYVAGAKLVKKPMTARLLGMAAAHSNEVAQGLYDQVKRAMKEQVATHE